jgi:hypothetical protein
VRGPRATGRDYPPPRRSSDSRLSALLTDTLRLVRSGRSADRLKSKNPACEAVRREALAISIPRGETGVIRHFQERMPYGLFVPEVPSEQLTIRAVSARNVVPLVIEENSRGAACRSGL